MMQSNDKRVFVVGVGMTKFEKPKTKNWQYYDMGREAGEKALKDAGIKYNQVDAVIASYCYGESTCGQRAAYELGLTGIPVYNVNNNCSSGSSALMLGQELIKAGKTCILILGFEQMESGLTSAYTNKIPPTLKHFQHMYELGADKKPCFGLNQFTSDVIKIFSHAAREYEKKYGLKKRNLSEIAWKNRKHGTQNNLGCLQTLPTLESIEKGTISEPITVGMSAMTADGGAACIICNEYFINHMNLKRKAVEIIAQAVVTDLPSTFEDSFMNLSGYELAKQAADYCYRQANLIPQQIDVVECHDCFSCNELFMYEALSFTKPGKGVDFFQSGHWLKNRNGGEIYKINNVVINPSGGIESKGHPIGATGLAQCAELCWQLRNEAGIRQVDDAKLALQHNYGIGSACVVTIYKKYIQNSKL